MGKYFQADGSQTFTLFSLTHWITLIIIFIVIGLIFMFREYLRRPIPNTITRIVLAIILLVSEITLHMWLESIDVWDVRYSLPLHLSSLSLILSAVLLISKKFSIFEFTYFAGMGSAIQAMITPDISQYTFPHFRYIHFFISHGGIVVANMFMVIVESYRPTKVSVWKAFLYLNIYTIFISIFNFLIEGNYMYISEKPVNPSVLDYLGPWPFYILPLEVIALLTFWLLYLPFGISDFRLKHLKK